MSLTADIVNEWVRADQRNEQLKNVVKDIYFNTLLQRSNTVYSQSILRACESVLSEQEIAYEKGKL